MIFFAASPDTFFARLFKLTGLLFDGVPNTLILFFVTIALSLPFGLALAFGRQSRFAPLRWVINGYVWLLRGTPLMLQLFFVYYGLPYLLPAMASLSRLQCGCLTFVLNYAAYYCEIFRGGLSGIDRGQHEAARVLGMSRWQSTWHITLPQMFRTTLPAVTNEMITLVKDTALVAAIGVTEVLFYAKSAVRREVDTLAYVVAAGIYLLLTGLLTALMRYLEKKNEY